MNEADAPWSCGPINVAGERRTDELRGCRWTFSPIGLYYKFGAPLEVFTRFPLTLYILVPYLFLHKLECKLDWPGFSVYLCVMLMQLIPCQSPHLRGQRKSGCMSISTSLLYPSHYDCSVRLFRHRISFYRLLLSIHLPLKVKYDPSGQVLRKVVKCLKANGSLPFGGTVYGLPISYKWPRCRKALV